MTRARAIVLMVMAVASLCGCAHKPLKAPCAREEGEIRPLAYAAERPRQLEPFEANANVPNDVCGPLKPINP